MKKAEIVTIIVLASWVCITFVLLVIYGQKEINDDIYVDVATNNDGTKISEFQGKIIVGHHSVHLMFLMCCIFIVGIKLTYCGGPVLMISILFIAAFITEEISIIENCSYGHPKCFQYRTPLYVLLLINSGIHICFPVGLLIAVCCGVGVKKPVPVNQPVNQPEMKQEQKQEEIKQEVIQEQEIEMIEVKTPKMTYETIIKIRTLDSNDKCIFCMDDLKVTDNMKILGCGHYFHKGCAKEWEKRSTKCPICKADIM